MPQLTFTDEERAEIERLVQKHSPANRVELRDFLQALGEEQRSIIVNSYEGALRETAKVALFVLDVFEETSWDWRGSYALVHDWLTQYDVLKDLHADADKIARALFGQSDSEIEGELWSTVPVMVREVLAPLERRELASA